MNRRDFLTISLKLGAVALIPQPILAFGDTKPNEVTLHLTGINPGSSVVIVREDTREVIYNKIVNDTEVTLDYPYLQDVPIAITQRSHKYEALAINTVIPDERGLILNMVPNIEDSIF